MTEALTHQLDESRRLVTGVGDTSTWLVGLSSTLLAVVAAKPARARAALGSDLAWVAGLLLATVILGALCRVLGVAALTWIGRTNLGVRRALTAALAVRSDSENLPDALSGLWDKDDIYDRIKETFGHEWKSLKDPETTLEEARKSYKRELDRWESVREREHKFLSDLSDCFGVRRPTSVDEHFVALRVAGRRAKWGRRITLALFASATAAFVIAVSVVGYAIVLSSP